MIGNTRIIFEGYIISILGFIYFKKTRSLITLVIAIITLILSLLFSFPIYSSIIIHIVMLLCCCFILYIYLLPVIWVFSDSRKKRKEEEETYKKEEEERQEYLKKIEHYYIRKEIPNRKLLLEELQKKDLDFLKNYYFKMLHKRVF